MDFTMSYFLVTQINSIKHNEAFHFLLHDSLPDFKRALNNDIIHPICFSHFEDHVLFIVHI